MSQNVPRRSYITQINRHSLFDVVGSRRRGMPPATDGKGASGFLDQDSNHGGYLFCVSGLNKAFRCDLRCQGPVRVDALGIQGVVGHVDILHASLDEGLTLVYTLSQLSVGRGHKVST